MRCHSQDELVARELEALFIEMAYQRVYYMLYPHNSGITD
jgi:hypothetical protein